MAIVTEKLLNLAIPTVEQTYTPKDAMPYALGVGLGFEPTDRGQLDFVYEKDLKVLPTFAVVLAHPGLWVRDFDTGIDAVKVVHGEQGLTLHRPLAPADAVIGKSRITGVVDKGEGRGALVMYERKIFAKARRGNASDRSTPCDGWASRARSPARSSSSLANGRPMSPARRSPSTAAAPSIER